MNAAAAMIIWLGVTPAQLQNVQSQDQHARKQNLVQQEQPRQANNLVLPSSMR